MSHSILQGIEAPETVFGMIAMIITFLVIAFLSILSILMPYFVWKIASSMSRCEELLKHLTHQSDLLTIIEGEITTNIAPATAESAGYVRAEMEHKYDIEREALEVDEVS